MRLVRSLKIAYRRLKEQQDSFGDECRRTAGIIEAHVPNRKPGW